MAFPTITYKATNTDVYDSLTTLVDQKLQTLEKFIGDETDTKCEVEFEKVAPRHSGAIYRIEVNLVVHGKLYRAEATEESFEAAIDEVRSELDQELRKANSKRGTLIKKGGRKIKDMLRFGTK